METLRSRNYHSTRLDTKLTGWTMMTRSPSDVGSTAADVLWRTSNQHDEDLEQPELSMDLPIAPPRDLFDEIVEISPSDLVKRYRTARYGIMVESIYASARNRIQFNYQSHAHLLILYEDGARRDGETAVDGLPPSRLRKLARKLTFVPAGYGYREWHDTSTAVRLSYLYLNPVTLENATHADAFHTPKVFFEDSTLWASAVKLKSVLESENMDTAYLESLANVLAHELSCSGQDVAWTPPPSRGGLASWQKRVVSAYIEEHLNEQIPLITLARLTRLSKHHFCRAFKQSFGVAPHKYHRQRRMQQAKVLLSDRAASITQVSLALGYPILSSFSDTFHKTTGQTPSQFRRNLK
jgi:AraC family transcriptional regulator